MWQCKWLNLVDNLRTLEVMSPDDQILIRFATNQKMHIEWNTNYVDSKKYRKYDVENTRTSQNIARGTTDPGIASITWIISPSTKQTNSIERKIQVKHSIGYNFGQMTLPALVLNLPTRWRHLKIQIKHSNFGN